MINNSKLVNEVIEQIKNLSKEDLLHAMKEVDKELDLSFKITASYSMECNEYKVSKELNNYSNIHIKMKKSFFDYFRKDRQDINDNLEAA